VAALPISATAVAMSSSITSLRASSGSVATAPL
jgi:hypothetical protein